MNIITLTNGKRVANFSSPHPFEFEDGSVLPAISHDEAERLKVHFEEVAYANGDVELSFSLTHAIRTECNRWQSAWRLSDVDVVFCPLPMIVALKEAGYDIRNTPFRSIRVTDRIKKLVSISKQCI